MNMFRVRAALVVVIAGVGTLAPLPASAQEVALKPGDRIRLRPVQLPRRGPRRIKGSLVSITADTLLIDTRGEIRPYALTDLKRIEISTGEKEHVAGTLIGIVGGGVLGLGLGSALGQLFTDDCVEFCGVGGAITGLRIGAVAGGFAGYFLLASEKWKTVPDDGLGLSVGPATIGLRLSL
ncbi:MAG: hypothetical protein ABFS14_11490 [Gemmatimonadota bacterium]